MAEEKQNIQEFDDRVRKLGMIREAEVNPYPERFERSHKITEVREMEGKELDEIKESGDGEFAIAGRIVLMRAHGKLSFTQLRDYSGQMQICFMQDVLGADAYKLLRRLDVGDFVGVRGDLFVTKHGELTLLVKSYEILSKTLRPMPEKFHGLKDQETRYRYRYLELLSDPNAFKLYQFRSSLIRHIREYLNTNEFVEIDTPILTSVASGATATPFATHHQALDIPMYLRIAPETYLKRAIVGGYERVYEVARCFRNEGIDPSHLQEFTMIEYYAAYWNYQDNMEFTEKMLKSVIEKLTGGTEVEVKDRNGEMQKIDFGGEWPRYKFADLIKGDCGIDILEHYGDAASLLNEIKAKDIKIERAETMGYGNLCDHLYKKVSRPKLIQPCFVINHPVETKPLARRNDEDSRLADSFQLLVNTWEVVNAYSELVDPQDQRKRLEDQAKAKDAGDEEAMPMDEDYLYAMEHGMPPMSGWGMGVDRIVALLTNQENLKDTVMFPIMRPIDY